MLLVTIPKVMGFSKGMKILDMMPTGYDAEYINALFSALGEEGRNAYLYNQIPVDLVYPFLFAISFCLLLAYLLNKLKKLDGPLFYLCLLPLLGGFFDYLENFSTIALLTSYPNISSLTASMANVFTILKSGFTTVYFVALIVTLLVFVGSVLSKRG
ncbi:MAG: hypothetical protein DHS20C18_08290 [Saprospiraceae bacterium]|nr:MAG: hypothetical protein DHS20C18_08290 [Saprospiraceae bacterium]